MTYLGSPPASQAFAPGTDTFNGDGTTVAFTLSRNVSTVNDIQVVVNNVVQQPTAYSVATSTLTFTAAPSAGTANIYVRYLSTNLVTIAPQQGSVYPSSLSTGGLYWDTTGNVGVGTTSPTLFSGHRTVDIRGTTSGGVLQVGSSTTPGGYLASDGTGTSLWTYGATPLLFWTNGLERMRILSTGNILSLSGGSTTATGTGIAFPATQSSSSDVNTLDDYEEGTWTPVLVPLAGTITGQTTTGNYTKIGRQVTVTFQANITSGTITSISGINNLPFAVSGNTCLGVARENAVTGTLWQILVAPSFTITFYTYSNTSGASSGYSWIGTATYFTST